MNNLTKLRNYLKPVKIGIELAEKEKRVGNMDVIADYFYQPHINHKWTHNLEAGGLVDEVMFKVDPTLFALVNGERIKGQLCLSHRFTKHHVLTAIQDQIDEIESSGEELEYLSIAQGDNPHWCECDICKNKNPYDQLINLLNYVAKDLYLYDFHTLLYYKTEQVGTVVPEPNVMVMPTTIQLSKGEPFKTSKRADAVAWRNNLYKLLELTTNVGIWDYYGNFKHLLAPNPTLYSLGENLKWYRGLGIQNYIIQTDAGIGHEFAELKSEIIKQMLSRRGVFRNPKSIILNWLRKEYGRAALDVRKYIDLLHDNRGNLDYLNNWRDLEAYRDSFLSDEVIDKMVEILNAAYERQESYSNSLTISVTSTGITMPVNRLDYVAIQLYYAMIELGIASKELIRDFKDMCTKLGNVTVNEQGKTWQEYLKEKGL